MKPIRVSLSVTSADQHVITRAVEALQRAAVGLALEGGVSTFLMIGPDEDNQEPT